MKWKDIKGYEDLYKVSDTGIVVAKEKHWTMHHSVSMIAKEKELKHEMCHGYKRVSLHKNKKYKHFFVHRLVAEAFVYNPNPEKKKYINHKDFNTENNNASNLEWVTLKENMIHSSKRCSQSALRIKMSKTGEHYIYLRENGKYFIFYNKIYKQFNTLNEAIAYRNEVIKLWQKEDA